METHLTKRPRLVIVGAGFAGVSLARSLRKAPLEIRLIDQNNYHTFQPLLYQVATAGLEPESIAHTVRGIYQGQKNLDFVLGKVIGVDKERQVVQLEDGNVLPYDYLALAAGATTNFFGIKGVADHAFTLKSIEDAIGLRSHILNVFEQVNLNEGLIEQGWLNFVVVGGGPTGVEMAGALIELFEMVLKKDFPHLPIDRAKVYLVEATPHVLAPFREDHRRYTAETLKRRGVQVLLDTKVIQATDSTVHLHTGVILPTQTLIWAAGIRVNPLADVLGLPQSIGGRIEVGADLSIPRFPNIFVMGDMAASKDENGKIHPQLAPNAMQSGRHVAKQILARLAGQKTQAYQYFDKGIMATIGRNAAVAEAPWGFRAKGWLAWLSWLFIHLMYLVGFRNRWMVFMDWTWSYLTYDRSARMIFPLEDPHAPKRSKVFLAAKKEVGLTLPKTDHTKVSA